jgi:DNA-binding transcriptional ArsR family regulator
MTADALTKQLKALSEPKRLNIMQLIESSEMLCVSQLAEKIGISIAGTSQHLSILEDAGLVVRTRESHRICYRYNTDSKLLKTLLPLIRNK